MTDINAWAAIDDNNLSPSPAGWPEGMMPSGVNNSARANMGALKRWRDQSQPTVTATGTANAQIITYPVAPASLVAGDVFSFYSVGTNTAAATLIVNAQAAKSVRDALGAPLTGGEMPAGALVTVAYDGTNLRLANTPSAAAIDAVLKTGDTMSGGLAISLAGAGTPLQITAQPTFFAFGEYAVAGARTWRAGCWPDGTYQVYDTTLALTRLSINAAGLVTAPIGVSTPVLSGGYSGAGTLRTYNSANDVCFNWVTGTPGTLFYRINNSVQYGIATQINASGFGYTAAGGPISVGLAGADSAGTGYMINVDALSDERIKDSIVPTEVDALATLVAVPVSGFEIKPEAAAWLQGRDDLSLADRRVAIGFVAQRLQEHVPEAVRVVAQPAHVPLPSDMHTVSMDTLVPYLVRAVQQLATRVEELETALIR